MEKMYYITQLQEQIHPKVLPNEKNSAKNDSKPIANNWVHKWLFTIAAKLASLENEDIIIACTW